MRTPLAAVLAAVLMTAAVPAVAEDTPNSPSDMGILPPPVTDKLALYDLYPVSAYQVDGDYGMTDLGSRMWKGITNALLLLTAVIAKLGVRATEWAFSMTIVDDLIRRLDATIAAMATQLWDTRLVHIAISCTGVWAAWVGMVLRRTSQAISVMLTVIVIVGLSTWSFLGGLTWALSFVNSASTEISGAILAASSRVMWSEPVTSDGGQPAFTKSGEAIWTILVAHPWAIAEFGDLSSARQYQADRLPGDLYLTMSAEDRKGHYTRLSRDARDSHFSWWKDTGVIPRLVVAFLALLVAAAYSGTLLVMAGAILAFQLLAVLILASAPIVLLAGLTIPAHGAYIVSRWALKILGALTTKIVFAAMLSVVLLFSRVLQDVSDSYGWAVGALLQLALIAAVVLKWKSLFGFFSSLPSSPERALHNLRKWHEPGLVRAGRLAVTGGATGAAVAGWRYARETGERRQAMASLNQRLAADQQRVAQMGARGTPTTLMLKAEERTLKGAHQPWTAAEIRAEMVRNRDLRRIGADPLAVPVAEENPETYRSQVEQVRETTRLAIQRLEALKKLHRPRVRAQAEERRGRRW